MAEWPVWLLVLVVVAAAGGPVFWLRPSAAERRQTVLRQRAAALGLKVKVTGFSDKSWAQALSAAHEPLAGYTLPWPEGVTVPRAWIYVSPEKLAGRSDGGFWGGDPDLDEDLRAWIASGPRQWPEQIYALECNALGLTLYWNERGSRATLDALQQWLAGLCRALTAGQPKTGS